MAELIHRSKTGNGAGNGGRTPSGGLPHLMRRMQTDFDDLFERYARQFPLSTEMLGDGWRWGLDVEDKDDCLLVRAEAPGFEAGDFDIQVSDNRLVLCASHKTDSKKKGSEYHEQCECYESMPLPTGIDKDKIDARYHNGVLTLTIPKTPQGKPKRIAVKG